MTGANGFIGRRLCARLCDLGFRVRGACRAKANGPWHECVTIDFDSGKVDQAALEGVDTIFHLAAKVHDLSTSYANAQEYWKVNVDGTRSLLEVAQSAGVRRFIFFSSVKAVGEGNDSLKSPINESMCRDPKTVYGITKKAAEELVLRGGFVPEPVVLRLCMTYGAGNKGNLSRMLKAVAGHRFPPLPEFGNRRSIVHVEDVVQAALLAASSPAAIGEAFFVTGGEPYSTRRIYEIMCNGLGQGCPPFAIPAWFLVGFAWLGDLFGKTTGRRPYFDSEALKRLRESSWYSSEKLRRMLGYSSNMNLEGTMPELIADLRQEAGQEKTRQRVN